ncbi:MULTISPECIES: hypothetical protein [unclassified Streptomyces]|uniref:hypothetical protein n=1 Tax=unclassified Streptomyces TaxID=2593676 RepID=UPI0004BDAD5E|nr:MULTISPECIES: hypothetical protein [unclassified Streptomyces]
MTDEGEAHMSRTPEPELPAKVPESGDALTPDLPPLGGLAPDLWDAEKREGTEDAPRTEADHPAEPHDHKDPKPQEPTD